MAPRRGGGGSSSGSGGSSESSCPGAFSTQIYSGYYSTSITTFIAYCIYWVALLGLVFAWRKVKKNNPKAKKLIGRIYAASIFCTLL